MLISGFSNCLNYDDFSIKLKKIETILETESPQPNIIERISEFIESNQGVFIKEKRAVIPLDSLAAKIRHLKGHEPLIGKLRCFVNRLIPPYPPEFLHMLRDTIFDSSERLQAIANWIDLMRIPLAQIELTEDEFVDLIMKLEYPDLTNFNLQSINVVKLTRKLPYFQFKTRDISVLSTLARHCAQKYARGTARHIQNFAFKNEQSRVEIAKLCAQKDGADTAELIENFAILEEQSRVEIAKLCAQHDGKGTSCFIHNFAILEEQSRVEIAKLCAMQDEGGTAQYIKNFDLRDESTRIEIAKLCAKEDCNTTQYSTAYYFENFAIENEFAKIEIAKLCAQQNGKGTAKYINKFDIRDQLARIEIAKLCAKKNGRSTAEFIKNFSIRDQLARFEIARLCAKENGWATAEYIQNFDIGNEPARSEIAKLCAQQDAGALAIYFRNFDIEEESTKLEIAKLCAHHNSKSTTRHIKNFALKYESTRIEIAKICALQEAGWTSYYIREFEILNEPDRCEIAKLCVQQDGPTTTLSFKNFAISDEMIRFEIAKLCALQSGGYTAELISNFAIGDEGMRYKIAKICAKQNGSDTAKYIHNFELDAQTDYQLYLDCILADPKSLLIESISFIEELIPRRIQILKSEAREESIRAELFEEIDVLIESLPISKESQKIVWEMSCKIQELPTHIQNTAGLWLVSSLLLMREMKSDGIEWMLTNGLWTELGLLKDPGLRVSLSAGLHGLRPDEDMRKLWESFLSHVRGTKGHRGLMLLVIPFINLQLKGIERSKLLTVANNLSALQKKKFSSFRNVYQIKNLLHTIHLLAFSDGLTAEQKQRGFEKIFFDPSSHATVMIDGEPQILKNVLGAKGLLQLKDPEWPTANENLSVLFRSSLEKMIPLEHYKGDVSAKYEKIFGTCRNPSGLLTYAAGLKTLRDPGLLSCLGQYVVSVMDETFKDKRYELTDNPHLAKIVEGNPGLLAKWKEEIQMDVGNMISGEISQENFHAERWLYTKLIVDKHLGSEKLPYLVAYFKATSLKERDTALLALIEELTQLNTLEGNTQLEKGLTVNHGLLGTLRLQKACLRLAKEGMINDKKILIGHLNEINQALIENSKAKTRFEGIEFARDVKSLLEAITKQTQNCAENQGDLKAVFTDDPIDLLLCGTDVSGSCQRLEGDPNINKGLLGYLMDGKNRLLAIKEGSKIVARCMLKLLWDGKQPVVYRERFYPDETPAAHKQALNALAKQVAEKLSLPLTCKDGNVPYNMTLQALGGPAPYEYSDGAGGIQKKGRFTINEVKILH